SVARLKRFGGTPQTRWVGPGKTSPVAAADVARGVAAVLVDPVPHLGRIYELTSPRSQHMRGVAREFSGAPAKPLASGRLPEPLRWDSERTVEARGRVLPRDDHRQLRDGVVVVVPLHAREQLVVDVTARLRDRVGVFERHLLRIAEERALRVVV